jgi:predicted DNA-binding antitoxin AbrB/MazE fold protein
MMQIMRLNEALYEDGLLKPKTRLPLRPGEQGPFLQDEWSEKKSATIVFFPRLSSFFGANFPDIKFAADLERALLVSDLQESSSFASTRRALQRLAPIADQLTAAQVEAVVDAALSNNQIYWIAGDADIKRFLQRIISHREQEIDDEKLVRFYQLLAS